MSFKDLESSISKALQEYREAEERKAGKIEQKAARREERIRKESRPPLYRPDAPQRYIVKVVINARMKVGDTLGELVELVYLIPTLSTTVAELESIKLAKDAGFVWRGTVSVEQI